MTECAQLDKFVSWATFLFLFVSYEYLYDTTNMVDIKKKKNKISYLYFSYHLQNMSHQQYLRFISSCDAFLEIDAVDVIFMFAVESVIDDIDDIL